MKNHHSIYQVHDKFFKTTFADKGVKESFLQTYLPSELLADMDLSHVEEIPANFISDRFHLEESDLLMKVRYKPQEHYPAHPTEIYILALMEHKSYKDRKPPFQVLKYCIDIWESQLEKKERLSPILPLVIYEGRKKWKYLQLEDYFKGIDPKWEIFLPFYQSLFYDFSLESKLTKLPDNILLRTYIECIQTVNIEDQRQFIEQTIKILELIGQSQEGENLEVFIKIVRRIITYAENVRADLKNNKQDLLDILKGESQMIINSVQAWEDKVRMKALQEGRQKGRQEGRQEGQAEEKTLIAERLKKMGLSKEMIEEATGVSL